MGIKGFEFNVQNSSSKKKKKKKNTHFYVQKSSSMLLYTLNEQLDVKQLDGVCHVPF